MIEAVIFDLGGVVFDSPLHVIAAYEIEVGISGGTINKVAAGAGIDGAWARHERGEISREAFLAEFTVECHAAGAEIDAATLMIRIEESITPRTPMLDAIATLRNAGFVVAALTNNWEPLADGAFKARFDVVVESSVEGVRKPQVEIYEIVLSRLGIRPQAAVFLDDIGANLKPARAMGMSTIKVVHPAQALDELSTLVGVGL